jgi:hypothetical protein
VDVQDGLDAPGVPGLVRDEPAHFAIGVDVVEVDRRMDDAVVERREVAGELERPGGAHAVADVALGVVDVRAPRVREHLADGARLDGVAGGRGRRVGVEDVDVARAEPRARECPAHAAVLAGGVGQHEVARVGADVIADHLAEDVSTAGAGVIQALQREETAAFRHDDAVARPVERARGTRRIRVVCQCALRGEAREDPEGVDALGDAAREREVDLPQLEHLHAVDQPQIARSAGATEAIRGPLDAKVERHLARGVVRDRARIVVV